jgi:hypothetical protein
VDHVDRRVRQRQPLRRAGHHLDIWQFRGARPGTLDEWLMRLNPDDRAGGLGEPRQVETVAAADIENVHTRPIATFA